MSILLPDNAKAGRNMAKAAHPYRQGPGLPATCPVVSRKFTVLLLLLFSVTYGQEKDKQAEKQAKDAQNLVYEANKDLAGEHFEDAEVNYRMAIARDAENVTARYNLGNAYYRRENLGEAFTRYKQAGETAHTREEKHRAYHNMGNVFMKNKEYEKAVEAYKEALRSDPTDEETRYNLALAKEMLEKNPPEDNQNEQDQNQDNDGGDQGDQGDKGDQGDQGDEGDDGDQQPEDQGDEGKDEEGEGKGDADEDQDGQPEEGQPEEGQGQPQPGQSQLSPQQIEALLDAMGREEKRVQDKINAKKAQGAKTSSEKDW